MQYDTCWDQSPWPYEYPPGYSRGVVFPQRKWFSNLYLGGAKERMALSKGMNVWPFWYTLDFALAARSSQDNQIVPYPGTAIVAMVATATLSSPSFRTRMFQIVDKDTQLEMDRAPVNDRNRFGTAQQPFYCMRPPMYPPDYGSLFVRCANLNNSSNTVQLCFIGLQPRPKSQ